MPGIEVYVDGTVSIQVDHTAIGKCQLSPLACGRPVVGHPALPAAKAITEVTCRCNGGKHQQRLQSLASFTVERAHGNVGWQAAELLLHMLHALPGAFMLRVTGAPAHTGLLLRGTERLLVHEHQPARGLACDIWADRG